MAVDKYYYNLEVLCLTWLKEVAKFKIPLFLPKLPHPTVTMETKLSVQQNAVSLVSLTHIMRGWNFESKLHYLLRKIILKLVQTNFRGYICYLPLNFRKQFPSFIKDARNIWVKTYVGRIMHLLS